MRSSLCWLTEEQRYVSYFLMHKLGVNRARPIRDWKLLEDLLSVLRQRFGLKETNEEIRRNWLPVADYLQERGFVIDGLREAMQANILSVKEAMAS